MCGYIVERCSNTGAAARVIHHSQDDRPTTQAAKRASWPPDFFQCSKTYLTNEGGTWFDDKACEISTNSPDHCPPEGMATNFTSQEVAMSE